MENENETAPVDQCAIPDLSGVVGFDYEDVLYNLAGRQSPAQQRQEARRLWRNILGLGLVAGSAVGTFWVGFRIGPVICLIVFAVVAVKTFIDAVDSHTGNVLPVEGDLWTQLNRGSESADEYYAHIAGTKLEITKEAYFALVPGGPYRIFYIPGCSRAVGGQVLPGWRPLQQPESKKQSWWRGLSIEIG